MNQPTTDFDPDIRAQLDAVIDHLNANHSDTVLLVARQLAGERLDDAELVAVDRMEARFQGSSADGAGWAGRLEFPETCSSIHDVQGHLLGTVAQARAQAAPDEPITSLEADMTASASVPLRSAVMARHQLLTPNLLEITVAGLDPYPPLRGEEFHYVLVSEDPTAIGDGYSLADLEAQGDDGPVRGAYYTARRVRPDAGELDLWVVLHDHAGGAADLLRRAGKGHRLGLWGPRRSFHPPADLRSILLVADETGFAAVAALMEELPAGARATAVLETVDYEHRPPLPGRDDIELTVRWVYRGRHAPGTGTGLLDTVAALGASTGADTGPRFDAAFGAAESRAISAVRRHLRTEGRMAAADVLMTGYWRRA